MDNNKVSHNLISIDENHKTIDNLIVFFQEHYHPTIFNSITEFDKTPHFGTNNITIKDYTDGYITENENYIIILFDNPLDFTSSTTLANQLQLDIIISYNETTRKILKYFTTGHIDEKIQYLECFVK